MKANYYRYGTYLFFIALTFISLEIPFFWDGAYFAKQARLFYFHHFSGSDFSPFVPNADLDNGGFPLFAVYLAFGWKLFGLSLQAAHWAMLPVLLGIVYEYDKLCKRFLSPQIIPVAYLLLCLEPCFLTQSMLMANDLFLVYFFLGALNALLHDRKLWLMLFLLLLSFTSIRGIAATIALMIIGIILNPGKGPAKLKSIVPAIPAFLLMGVWAIYHHSKTGWYFFSPLREHTDEHFLGITAMVKQFILILWKLVDSGRIFLWVTLLIGWFILRKKKESDASFKTLLLLLLIPLLVFMGMMVPLSNPSSARYFMMEYLLLCIACCMILQQVGAGKKILITTLICAGLISGNFWIYPERFSNGWDTSLKVVPFFGLEHNMRNYVADAHIPSREIATQFPLIDNYQDTYIRVADTTLQYTNALAGPVTRFHYYLHSNVCNTDLLPQIEAIRPKWKLLKEFRRGQVYLSLYENPDWRKSEDLH